MSTLELPASIALILVMANLALCLSAERWHPPVRSFVGPVATTPAGTTACEPHLGPC